MKVRASNIGLSLSSSLGRWQSIRVSNQDYPGHSRCRCSCIGLRCKAQLPALFAIRPARTIEYTKDAFGALSAGKLVWQSAYRENCKLRDERIVRSRVIDGPVRVVGVGDKEVLGDRSAWGRPRS